MVERYYATQVQVELKSTLQRGLRQEREVYCYVMRTSRRALPPVHHLRPSGSRPPAVAASQCLPLSTFKKVQGVLIYMGRRSAIVPATDQVSRDCNKHQLRLANAAVASRTVLCRIRRISLLMTHASLVLRVHIRKAKLRGLRLDDLSVVPGVALQVQPRGSL